jgi:hypothetical protein
MYRQIFPEFLESEDTLRVYDGDELVFSSTRDRLLPLLEYLERFAPNHREVVSFDKIMGNAAALLSVRAGCREVYSPLGSQLAIKSLDKYGVSHHLLKTVPYICNAAGTGMCPMEKLSLGKTPEEFHRIMLDKVK